MYDPKNVVIDRKKNFVHYPEDAINLHDTSDTQYCKSETHLVLYDVPPIDTIKVLVFDIETTGLDPHADDARVYMIGVKVNYKLNDEHPQEIILCNRSEKQLLISFWQLLVAFQPDVIANHNIFNFDIPYLKARYFYNDLGSPFNMGKNEKTLDNARVFGKPIKFTPYYCDRKVFKKEVSIIDTYHQLILWDAQKNKLADGEYNLKKAPGILKLRPVDDRVTMSYNQMMAHYKKWMRKEGTLDEMKEYLKDDIRDAMLLVDLVLPDIHYQRQFLNWNIQRISTTGNASKWSEILDVHYKKNFIHNPVEKDHKYNYQGAYTKAIAGIYGYGYHIIQIDFASLYPNTILKNKVYCQKKDPLSVILMYMDYMTTKRLSIKHSPDQAMQYLQSMLKIFINSGYGMFGSGAPFNDLGCAAFITAYSRKITKYVEQLVYDNGGIVVQIDTDGLVCAVKDPDALMAVINEKLPTGFTMDCDRYDYIYIPAFPDGSGKKKNYFLYKDGKIKKMAGITRSRAILPLKREFYHRYLTRYLYNGEMSALKLYKGMVKMINSGNLPMDLITITKTASVAEKKVRELGLVNENGQAVFYYGDEITYRYYKNGKVKETHKHEKRNKGAYSKSYYIGILDEVVEEIELSRRITEAFTG